MVDAGQLLRHAVLTPAHGLIAVEQQRGVGAALRDEAMLQVAVALPGLALLGTAAGLVWRAAWTQVDQQPPHTPLHLSASCAKASQVSRPSGLIVHSFRAGVALIMAAG